MIALLENEFVSKRRLIEEKEFLDMIAVAESTPGPIAINSATYIGYKTAGFIGALTATFAVCLPSFIIIYIISLFLDGFMSLVYVKYAFKGIQVCVVYLIFSAGLKMYKSLEKNIFNKVILISVIAAMIIFSVFAVGFSSIYYIIICGAAGLFVYLMSKRRRNGES